ncbi:MAG TPA: response regulator transcription factor [Limnobacter sp.]|uniref:response regulator transcription factor n=1 Tax=Limnobacter sp. TaxID=2003368 RepID=UPI002ED9FB18
MSLKPRILVVEDDTHIAQLLQTALGVEGYDVAVFGKLAALNAALPDPAASLILLDLGLPDGDGLDWLHRQRQLTSASVMVLSAREAEIDKVTALDMGADDYIAKPFGVNELLARVRANLRRQGGAQNPLPGPVLVAGDLSIDVEHEAVYRAGEKIHLTAKELKTLMILARAPGKLVKQRELLQTVWGPEYLDDTHYLRILMSKLRAKLEENPSEPKLLLTEPGLGYRLQLP